MPIPLYTLLHSKQLTSRQSTQQQLLLATTSMKMCPHKYFFPSKI